MRRRTLLAAAASIALGLAAGLLWTARAPEPTGPPRPSASLPVEAALRLEDPAPVPAEPATASDSRPALPPEAEPAAPDDPTGDLTLYAERPMSDVPHRVVRAWGAGPASPDPGYVSAYVVVEPGLDDASLEALALDVRRFHRSAAALTVRIVDDERAATYDRHEDGGALLAEHLVGRVQRSESLGLDEIELRGRRLEDVF